MVKFAEAFPDVEIVSTLSTQLSWSHLVAIVALKTPEARAFYAQHAVQDGWSVRELNHQIDRKAFERTEIAAAQSPALAASPAPIFKDPYFLDFLGLHQSMTEPTWKPPSCANSKLFNLELGRGFAFVERQERMVVGREDFYLDLLFFHRRLRRPVAIELKLGRFKAAHKGQMELYLKWLDKHERQAGEEAPIGLILPGGRRLAKTWPGSNFEISGSRKLPSTPPDLRPSAGALHEAIHRRVLPSAREAGTCLRQFFDTRWRGPVR
jgi:predicted nuclease of restriction endonuclease-like (RecB) superfamily